MRKSLAVFAVLGALAAPAFAGPCVALDYQEMKDMSAENLVKEACKARAALKQSFKENEMNRDSIAGHKPFPNAQENFDQCAGQIPRIDRVLESKGVSKETAAATCSAQGGDQSSVK